MGKKNTAEPRLPLCGLMFKGFMRLYSTVHGLRLEDRSRFSDGPGQSAL